MMSSSKGASKAMKSAQHAQVPGASAGSSRHRHDSGKSSLKKTPKLGKDGGALRASIHAKRILSGKIGKRPINGYVSRTMKNQHKLNIGHRPKRNAIYRAWDYTAGLSWKEEKELKKAISASLQESKKPTKPTGLDGNDLTEMTDSNISSEHFQSGFVKHGKKSLKLQMPDHKQHDSQPPSSDTSAKSLTFQGQVRAQRKFAQGSRPCSPGCSPAKGKNSQQNKMLTTKKAKTEDFLTFLCLRGSPSLPPHLDFMNNTAECESLPSFPNTPRHSQDGSRPSTPLATPTGNRGRNGDSSRCESPDVEITLESNDLGVKPLPLDTPDSTPVKNSNGTRTCNSMTMEADTTVADDNVSDDTNDVVIVNPEIEKPESKSPYGRLSLGKMRRESNKTVTKSARHSRERSVSRSPQRPVSTPSPRRSRSSPSPRRPNSAISPKKQKKIVESEDNTEQKSRTLRSGIITNEPEVVDLTETDDQSEPKKEEDKSTSRRLGRKATLSPAHESFDSEGVPTRKRLKSGDSATSRETSVTPDRALRRSAVKRQLNTPSTSQEETVTPSRRAHLRSATSSPMPSPAGWDIRSASDNRLSADRNRDHLSPEPSKLDPGCEVKKDSSIRDNFKREDSRHKSGNRSKPGSVPKAAIRSSFPKPHEPSRLTVAPTYHPSAEQFQDPITYLETIRADAESYGMCRIVPPEGWKPECNISEDLRFSTQVQYIHKMANRWGPCVKTLECIKQHLKSQDLTLEHPPCTGGVEIDLPALSEVVQTLGGLQQVINKNKWPKVIDLMNLPKSCQQRTSQLYDIYCKYLLSYETLGLEEKHRLQQDVESRHQRGSKHIDTTCSTKGRSKPLGEFFRIAQNTQSMWFKEDEPTTEQVEELYWEMVCKREKHVSVQIAHIDTKHCGSAFPAKKDCPYSRHGWNYNILQHHSSSVLKHLGQVTGLTVPMLHIGMLFSTSCWARDPHFLPYIVYSHSGADVIWYCSPTSEESKFKKALEEEAPNLIDSQSPIWLPEDTVMTEPGVLLDQGVSLCRTVQKQGEFIIVFPKAFTATVSCGYNISESLHFASDTWLPLGFEAAELLYASGEPDLFSMERLLVLLGTGDKIPIHTLQIVLPLLEKVIDAELDLRKRLGEAGLQQAKKIKRLEELQQIRKRSNVDLRSDNEIRCDLSSKICFFSTVVNELEGISFALQDALQHIRRKKNLRSCKLLYTYDQKELRDIVEQVKNRISSGRHPGRKKSSSKSR